MELYNHLVYVVLLLVYPEGRDSRMPFETAFENCHKNDTEFDSCILNALNKVRPYFKTGVPEWNLPPFDPFFAGKVVQSIGKAELNYKLTLINVTEAGWTQSTVISFRSDFQRNLIEYTQFFPAKFLEGMYELDANILSNQFSRTGHWNLALYGFVQTTTITRNPRISNNGTYRYDTPLKVTISIQTTKDMALHITNLLGGKKVLEIVLDKIINTAWLPGFVLLKPLINDLVGTAFTDIFNMAFEGFPFEKLIH